MGALGAHFGHLGGFIERLFRQIWGWGLVLALGRGLLAVVVSLWWPLGCILGLFGMPWSRLWVPLGSVWGFFERLWKALGLILGTLGCHLGHFFRKAAELRRTNEFLRNPEQEHSGAGWVDGFWDNFGLKFGQRGARRGRRGAQMQKRKPSRGQRGKVGDFGSQEVETKLSEEG